MFVTWTIFRLFWVHKCEKDMCVLLLLLSLCSSPLFSGLFRWSCIHFDSYVSVNGSVKFGWCALTQEGDRWCMWTTHIHILIGLTLVLCSQFFVYIALTYTYTGIVCVCRGQQVRDSIQHTGRLVASWTLLILRLWRTYHMHFINSVESSVLFAIRSDFV